MKKLLLVLLLLLSIKGFSQAITVNTQTPAQLVNTLVENACLVQITNITSSTGSNFGSVSGLAGYQNTNPGFPVTGSGVLLTTGQASASPGPNSTVLSGTAAAWVGDPGLEAALASAGITMTSRNATSLQFDFIPNSPNFSMDFLFASEEYGSFQCGSNDAFVVLLTPLNGGPTVNLARTPVTNSPITVDRIKNILYNSNCPSTNPSLFGEFNGGGAAAASPTNYNGQTVLMNVSNTSLVPNNPYRIRFVIADDGGDTGLDGDYDSAVFLPAGSLNLGQRLFPNDLTVANGMALCTGDSYVLNTNLNPAIYDFAWTQDGDPVDVGATDPSITVTEPGDYAVTISRPDIGCVTTQTITIEYTQQINPADPVDLYACEGGGTYVYELSINTPIVKQGLDPATTVSYHASLNNANNNVSPLPLSYTSPAGVTIWVRINSHNSNCYVVKSFQLLTSAATQANQPGNLTLCEAVQGTNNAVFDLTQQTAAVLGSQDAALHTVTYFTTLANANNNVIDIPTPESFTGTNQTIYVRVQKTFDNSCFATTSFTLTVKPLPVLPAASNVNVCNSYTLPNLTVGAYYTGSGGTGTTIAAGTVLTTSQVVYIYAQSGGTPNCSNQVSFNVNIVSAATAPDDVTSCESYTLPELEDGEYRNAPNGGGNIIPAGTVINTTTTIYFFIPSAAACTGNNSFTVTITSTPAVVDPADVNSCGPYTLPFIPSGQNYFTGTNGTGTQLPIGYIVSTSQLIYIYTTNVNNPACTAQSSFQVTVNNVQVADRPDIERCSSYTLPTLPVGNYYTGPGGSGTMIPASTNLNTSQMMYVYAVSPTDPSCFDEDSFMITIYPRPALSSIPNVTACTSYTLPALQADADYYTGPDGTGNMLSDGAVITTSQTIYVLATGPGPLFCTRERTFTVTIVDVDEELGPGDQIICHQYILPALPANANYYTGPGGTGTQIAAGTIINATQTIYARLVTNTTPVCVSESVFTITIKPRPVIQTIEDKIACNSYTLPALPQGNYFTGAGGTGTMLPAGTVIVASQNLYAYAETGGTPNCTRERSFSVTIVSGTIAPANVTACGSYTLPELEVGSYRTAAAGGGNAIPVGTQITTSQTIFVYAETTSTPNCTDDDSFTVTINPAVVADNPDDVVSCVDYTLPALTNGVYRDGPGGTGNVVPAGTVISTNQTLYVYNSSTGVNCTAENSFTITITDITVTDMPDVLVCDGYALPALPVGNYFTGPGGTGTALFEGDIVDTDGPIYIYAATSTAPICTDEEDFTVTIKPAPLVDDLGNVGSCGNYTLPALTNGNYFTGSGGTGTAFFAGQVISTTQDLYIFAESGGVPNCTDENMFSVIINPAAPDDVTVCGSYTLPVLPVGNYFTQPAGQGTPKLAGDVITTTQDIYVYVELNTTPNCTDNNMFTVTIIPYPVLDPVTDITTCDSYQLPVLSEGNYYTGPGGTGTVLPQESLITTTQTVYVYADTNTTPNCPVEQSFLVTIYNTPLVDARSDILACDFYELDDLVGGNYFTQPNGQGDPLFSGDQITETQTIYIYGESGTTPNCYDENSFLVEIFTITADDPADVVECDSYILPALTVGDYYALSGGPTTPGQVLYNAGDEITTTTSFWIYAETGGRINCTNENPFTVTIYQTPVVDDTQGDVAQCSAFTLPALTTGTYYNGPLGTGGVIPANTQITTPRTVYVYAAAPGSNGVCFDQHSFFVDVNIVDVTAPADVTICGVYTLPALASGNYYTGQNGTGTMLNAGDQITSTQTIYVYQQAGTTVICSDQEQFTVTIISAPIPNIPDPLTACGIDDEGHGIFNLTPALAQALGGQPNAAASVHETLFDAQFDEEAITNLTAYTNIEAFTQTLYIRLESTLSDCYSIVELELIVNPRPVATEPTPYILCDGLDNDGIANFDLSTKRNEVLGTLNPAQYTVTYYETVAAANAGTPAIGNATNYPSGDRIVYVRVQNNATGCYDVVELELIVSPLPIAIDPAPYSLCDDNNPGDQVELFDLTSTIPDITQDALGVIVTFHRTFLEAQTPSGAITNTTAFPNESTVQTLFVRVETEATGCFQIVLLDIRVEPLPLLDLPAEGDDEITVCDSDANGYAVFDLQALIPDLLNGGSNIDVFFYETQADAEAGNNNFIPNTSNYTNSFPWSQTIYIRAENTVTGCVRTIQNTITLTVEPSPQVPDLENLVLCDEDSNNQNQITAVDLTQQNAVIYAGVGIDPDYIITYYTLEANAIAGSPRITNPTTYNGSNGQVIWVRVENPDLECFGISSFQLEIGRPLDLTTPAMYTTCNEMLPNDNIGTFDLTTRDNEILGVFGVGNGYTVTYYEMYDDIASGVPIPNPTAYNNPVNQNPQTIYVVVTSPEGCKSETTLTLSVLPLPTPNVNPDPIERCDDNASPDGIERFDLTEAEAQIRNSNNTYVITYHQTYDDADNDTAAIPVPTNFISGSATIYVRVEANTGNPNDAVCYQIVELELIVNPLPSLGEAGVIPPFAYCEINTDGQHTFILNQHNSEILSDGQNPDDFRIRFYLTHANAVAGAPALPNQYTNQTLFNQTIWVRVENEITDCLIISSFQLLVEEAAIANPVTVVLDTCDEEADNDGIATFDLTPAGAEALGAQNPLTYSVAYYTSLEDAEEEVDAIADPAAFTNTDFPDNFTIWIRVTNTATISRCNEITTLDVRVERLAEPIITAIGNTVCYDALTDTPESEIVLNSGITAPGYTFEWFIGGAAIPGEVGPTLTTDLPGVYTVIATGPAPLNCESLPSDPFTVIKSGQAAIPVGDSGYTISNYFADNQVITVEITGFGNYTYSLDNGPFQESPVFTNVSSQSHTITVRDNNTVSCGDFQIFNVRTVDYPKFFTPNGDGYHDTWNITGMGGEGSVSRVNIFDRFGKLVKQLSTSDASTGWDGTMNGSPLPADDYWFTIEYVEDNVTKEFKSHFALKR